MIVFDDAPPLTPLLAAAVTTFAGQNCMAGSRILSARHRDQVRSTRERVESCGRSRERTLRWDP